MSSSGRWRLVAGITGAIYLALAAVAGASAAHRWGSRFPSLFVDPFGEYSLVRLPHWGQSPPGLRSGDRLVGLAGQPFPRRLHVFDHPMQRTPLDSSDRGARATPAVFERADGSRLEIRLPLRRLGWVEVWVFLGVYALTGAFVLASAVLVLAVTARPGIRLAYGFWAGSVAAFLISFYDFHTCGWLQPVFTLSSLGILVGPLLLAVSFLEPSSRPLRFIRLTRGVVCAAACLIGGWLLARSIAGDALRVERHLITACLPFPFLLLGVVISVRACRGPASERADLRAMALGLAFAPLAGGAAQVVTMATGIDCLHTLMPALFAALPLSVGFALARRNVLRADLVVHRRFALMPLLMLAVFVATLAALLAERAIARFGLREVAPLLVALATGGLVIVVGRRLLDRALFSATNRFRPTIERLGDELTAFHDSDALRRSVANAIRTWLASASKVEVLDLDALPRTIEIDPEGRKALLQGERVWVGAAAEGGSSLLVPMRSLGEVRGVLWVPRARDSRLLTDEEIEMLDTVASIGAIALHHAQVLGELEALRKMQLDALNGEKRLALGTLGAEISHELAYPLNYFRHLLHIGATRPLSAEDLEIGLEEVARLERMLQNLRRLRPPRVRREPVPLALAVRRSLHLCGDLIREKALRVMMEIPEGVEVSADLDALVQLMSNLLRNAAQAAPRGGRFGVCWTAQGGFKTIGVWDEGAGVPEELRTAIFSPWVTTREGGSGLGLAVAQRIVRGLGWRLSLEPAPGRTLFRVCIPPELTPDPLPSENGAREVRT